MANATTYPRDFREKELRVLFDRIIDGDSLSIIGIGTVGKTQLLEHFTGRADVQSYFLETLSAAITAPSLLFVRIDPNAMLDPSTASLDQALPYAWPAFELIFRRLLEAVHSREEPRGSLSMRVNQLYLEMTQRERLGPQRAYPLLEQAIDALFARMNPPIERLVIVFDEFNALADTMPNSFFLNLRALRDRFRYKLLYIISSRLEIRHLFDDQRHIPIEPFLELFRRPLYLGAYSSKDDLDVVLDYLVARKMDPDWFWPAGTKETLVAASGGHSGLMRTAFEHLDVFQHLRSASESMRELLKHPAIQRECQSILDSFTADEQAMLRHIAAQGKLPARGLPPHELSLCQTLQEKHVLELVRRSSAPTYQVRPPLLAAYLTR